MGLDKAKKAVRIEAKKRLEAADYESLQRASMAISSKLLALLEGEILGAEARNQDCIVLCYYPMGREVNILPCVKAILQRAKVYFPKCQTSEELEFYQVENLGGDFAAGAYGILEPITDVKLHKEDMVGKHVLVIVPGVAFDHHLNRMGRGAGYYDRFLTDCSCKIGVCYDCQMWKEDLPVGCYDVQMDILLTEEEAYMNRGLHGTAGLV